MFRILKQIKTNQNKSKTKTKQKQKQKQKQTNTTIVFSYLLILTRNNFKAHIEGAPIFNKLIIVIIISSY